MGWETFAIVIRTWEKAVFDDNFFLYSYRLILLAYYLE